MVPIEIKSDVLNILIEKAEEQGKPLTEIIDEILRKMLFTHCSNGSLLNPIQLICHNCRNEIDYEINNSQGYCDYCESVVFIDKI